MFVHRLQRVGPDKARREQNLKAYVGDKQLVRGLAALGPAAEAVLRLCAPPGPGPPAAAKRSQHFPQ
jgi:hypothetical protein